MLFNKEQSSCLSDESFFELINELHKLTTQYQMPNGGPNQLRWHTYASQYDAIINNYGINKKTFIKELNLRLSKV